MKQLPLCYFAGHVVNTAVAAVLLLLRMLKGSYESYDSPPKLVDPFRYLWTKAFRMEWWRQQLAFLRDTSQELAVDAAYLWPVGSWDIAAIYHPDTKGVRTAATHRGQYKPLWSGL
jgi:hypothetical protein